MNPVTLKFKDKKIEEKYDKINLESKLFYLLLTLIFAALAFCIAFIRRFLDP